VSVRYLLDTNIVIFALRTRAEALRARFAAATDQMAVSTITVAELAYGVERSSRPDQNRGAVEEFLARAYEKWTSWSWAPVASSAPVAERGSTGSLTDRL